MKDPLKSYRRKFRIWKNDLRLKRERRYYESAFESRRLTIPDEETIKGELMKRFPVIRRKTKGALNILAIYHHYNWEDQALKLSLERFGKVRRYDWAEQFNHQEKN
jgi:hypothetical protein